MKRRCVQWVEYLKFLQNMAHAASSAGNIDNIDVVVGLTRGGLIPAVYLSHALKVPMITLEPHRLHANGTERESIKLLIAPPVVKNVLIVDDIADTGKTFTKCVKFLSSKGFKCYTMSVFINAFHTMFSPDYPGEYSNNEWIVFPYEQEEGTFDEDK